MKQARKLDKPIRATIDQTGSHHRIRKEAHIMNAPLNIQTINGADGNPAFVVIPYAEYIEMYTNAKGMIPDPVVRRMLVEDMTPVRAWREHLGLTQADMAARLGITQPSYAQQEKTDRLRKSSMEKIAGAMGISVAQLDV